MINEISFSSDFSLYALPPEHQQEKEIQAILSHPRLTEILRGLLDCYPMSLTHEEVVATKVSQVGIRENGDKEYIVETNAAHFSIFALVTYTHDEHLMQPKNFSITFTLFCEQ